MANKYTYWGVVACIVLALVALVDYLIIGEVIIGIYAAIAFWRYYAADVFRLAMLALGVMLIGTVLGRQRLANAFAAYAFLLFMVGVFVLVRELWRFSQALRKQRQKGED